MRFPNSLSPEAFLAACWQKQALFMPGALDGIHPSLSSGDLAWLATQADVESRLVMTQSDGEKTHYEVRHGPFEKDVLSSLPRQNWTLLVQDVEKHLPDFRALLAIAGFIPDWRIDDLMVSFAAPGGSVGPHMDNYDVFLCQGEGRREWHLGDADNANPDPLSLEMSLLHPFIDPDPQTATDGDILYLPPGVPHWGIATDFCMTYSIGMRAPTLAELNATAARLFDEADDVTIKSSVMGADVFYEDPDLAADEAEPGLISNAAIHRARKLLANGRQLDDVQTAMSLGATVTDPKAWLAPDCPSDDEAANLVATLDQDSTLGVHGMARIAYCQNVDSKLVFANGHLREVDADLLGIFRDICKNRSARGAVLCADSASGLTRWLLTSGVFDLTEPTA